MKVIHVPFGFYPDPVGGTEVYVHALSMEMQKAGVDVLVAAPAREGAHYNHGSLPVRRFQISGELAPLDLYGDGDMTAAQNFGALLDEEKPNVVHLHSYTSAASLRLLREVRSRKIMSVFTYHTPTFACMRGTLMRWGTEVCDGVLREGLCARCCLHGLGLPRGAADILGSLPAGLAGSLQAGGLLRKGGIAFGMRGLARARHAAVRTFLQQVDQVVALCGWGRDVLRNNGVPDAKITLCRHGIIAGEPRGRVASRSQRASHTLRIAFLGRLHPTKGTDTLIRAMRRIPGEDVSLDIFGVTQGEGSAGYAARIKWLAGKDARVRFPPPVSAERVVDRLREYDLLVVPSQWLETGPLVVLEAFAAGIPVVGSRLGGIREMIEDDVNGVLVEPRSEAAWAAQIRRLCRDRGTLERLRAGVTPPRVMADVAREMLGLYARLNA